MFHFHCNFHFILRLCLRFFSLCAATCCKWYHWNQWQPFGWRCGHNHKHRSSVWIGTEYEDPDASQVVDTRMAIVVPKHSISLKLCPSLFMVCSHQVKAMSLKWNQIEYMWGSFTPSESKSDFHLNGVQSHSYFETVSTIFSSEISTKVLQD